MDNFINFFQLNNNNPVLKLLIKQKQNNLVIDLTQQYKFINNIVEEYIDNIPRTTWKNTVKIYCSQLKYVNNDIRLIQYQKDRLTNKSLISQYIQDYPNEQIRQILNKGEYSQLEKAYENLTPTDKENINNWLKKNYVKDPSYHEFYNYFVPLKIQKELETSNLTGLCTFKDNITIRIKIPEHKKVKFQRGPQSIQPFDKTKVIENNHIQTLVSDSSPCPKPDGQTKIIIKPDKFHRLLLARILFFSKFIPDIHVHIFESKFNKKLDWHSRIQVNNKITKGIKLSPEDQEILTRFLGPKHINTGYTIPSERNITIYRTEELHKITIHELIHALGIDRGLEDDQKFKCIFQVHLKYYAFCPQNISCGYDMDNGQKRMKCNGDQQINEDSVLRLTEGYTDTIADLFNTLFCAIDLGKKEHWDLDKILNKHAELIKAEISFAIFQVAKLLLYFNFNDYRDLFRTARRNGQRVSIKDSFNRYLQQRGGQPVFADTGMPTGSKNKWTILLESTSVFSYFLIRLVLLLSINELSKEFEQVYKLKEDRDTLIDFWNIKGKQQIVRNIIAKNIMLPCTMVDLTMILIRHLAPVSIYPSVPDDLDIINEEVYPQELLDTLRRSLFSQ